VDPGSLRDNGGADGFDPAPGTLPGFSRGQEQTRAYSYALFAEDNIHIGDLTLTPGLRYDDHHSFGDNFSPSLNASYRLDQHWTLKAGISRAYKTPNLYQANPNYLLYSRGRGCFGISNPCFLQGSDGLRPETSVNKELGLAFDTGSWRASTTWFRNDYKDKIESGIDSLYLVGGTQVYQWTNVGKAVVEGFEGNLFIPLAQGLDWNTNLTYIKTSENRQTGQPLSVIPKYTVNTTLDWQATDRLSLQANAVWYGKQTSPTLTRATNTPIEGNSLSPYALFGVSGGYQFSEHLSGRLGVSNLFDKRLYREGNAESGAGAATYNEPGRALYASLTTRF
jgi:ferric enterobactin receptor